LELDLVPGVDLGLRGALRRDNLGGCCGLVVVGRGLLRAAGAEASGHDRGRGVASPATLHGVVVPALWRWRWRERREGEERARTRVGVWWFTHGGRGTVGGMVVK
jgi:hypothetical protein